MSEKCDKTTLKEVITTAISAVEKFRGQKVVAFIHTDKWSDVPEDEKLEFAEAGIEVISPNSSELRALADFLGVEVSKKFWSPSSVYLMTEKDWRRQVESSLSVGTLQ